MTLEEQRAAARKYDTATVWLFAEQAPGEFVLYNPVRRETVLITNDWNEVLRAYRARAPFVPYVKPAPARVNMANLEFKL